MDDDTFTIPAGTLRTGDVLRIQFTATATPAPEVATIRVSGDMAFGAKSMRFDGRNIPFDDIRTAVIKHTDSRHPMMLHIDSPGGVLNGMRDLIESMRDNGTPGVGSVGSWKAWTVPCKHARVTRTTRKHLPKRIQGRLRSLKQRGKR